MQTAFNVNAEAQRVLAAGPDCWAQLGVPRGADLGQVKQRYKKLCALHPDKNLGNQLAADAFAVVSAAYAELQVVLAPTAAPAAPLHSSQPEVSHGNRWQAFTGAHRHQQKPQPAQRQQQQQQPFPGAGDLSQENRTPSSSGGVQQTAPPAASGAGGAGSWQASRWSKQGGSALLRAQPVVAPAPGGACSGPGSGGARQQHVQPAGGRAIGGIGGRQEYISSDPSSGSENSSDEEDAIHTSCRPTGAAVKPSAFYGSSNRRPSPQVAAAAPGPPVASLYGVFGARRSSGGQPSGWLGSQQQQQQEQQEQHERPPSEQEPQQGPQPERRRWLPPEQPAWREHEQQPLSQQAAPAAASQPEPAAVAAAAQGGSRWGSKSRLELLKRPVVPAAAAVPAAEGPGGESGTHAAAREQQQQSGPSRLAKRQQLLLSASSSSAGEEGDGGSDEGDSGFASDPEPDAVSMVRDALMQAVQQKHDAARRAAQAAGAAIALRGRGKALTRYRKKRQKKAAAGSGANNAVGTTGGRSSGKAAGGRGSGKAAGEGKKQTQLKLTVVHADA